MTAAPAAPAAVTSASGPDPCAGYDFRNFRYYLPDYGIVTVADGSGARGAPGTLGYVALQIRGVLRGDIGGVDDNAETVVFTLADTGKEGRYSDVHVFTCTPAAAVTLVVSAGSGDRAYGGVRSIAMDAGRLVIVRYADDQGACCPGALSTQSFSLKGSSLVPVGPPIITKYTSLNAVGPVVISFLATASNAALGGDTAQAKPAGLTAYTGQRLKVTVLPAVVGEHPVAMDIQLDGVALGTVTSGASTVLTLPADGYYELRARPLTAGEDGPFEAEVTIGRSGDTTLG